MKLVPRGVRLEANNTHLDRTDCSPRNKDPGHNCTWKFDRKEQILHVPLSNTFLLQLKQTAIIGIQFKALDFCPKGATIWLAMLHGLLTHPTLTRTPSTAHPGGHDR